MNFLLRHQPVLTFDVDLWIRDEEQNLKRVVLALRDLGAQWGRDDQSWGPVPDDPAWLRAQPVYCLTTRHGALDIFREVRGLEGQYEACHRRALAAKTAEGVPYRSLADEDMLACQTALPTAEQRNDRVAYLRQRLGRKP